MSTTNLESPPASGSGIGLFGFMRKAVDELKQLNPALNVYLWNDARWRNGPPPRAVFVPTSDRPESFGPAKQTARISRDGGRSLATRMVPLSIKLWAVAGKMDGEQLSEEAMTERLMEQTVSALRTVAEPGFMELDTGVWEQPQEGQRGVVYTLNARVNVPVLERKTRKLSPSAIAFDAALNGTDADSSLTYLPATPSSPEDLQS